MNIGFDAKRLFNNFTGLGNYSRTLVKNLYSCHPENSYTLYTPRIRKSSETDYFGLHNKIRTFVPITRWKAYWRSFSIVKQLQKDNIELFHGLSHEIPFGISKTGIKSVVTIHDLIFKVYPETYSALDRIIYNLKFKYACVHSDVVVAISENTKRDIVRYFQIDPAKIEVVYQSCNPLFNEPKNQQEIDIILKDYNLPQDFLLYVGSVIERKNLITLIESYAYLPEHCKLPLVVVGKGKKYKEQVRTKIAELHLEDKVIWIDNLADNNHLQAIYQQASIFIYPSLYEGFGIPIIEALLCRTPLITANTSSLPEAGGPSSYYIDPLDAKQMATGIEKILSDAEYRNKMVENGYTYAREMFKEEVVTERLMEVYRRVLS